MNLRASFLVLIRVAKLKKNWLSRGESLNRLFELRDAVREFLGGTNKSKLVDYLNDSSQVAVVAYLADIFKELNQPNSSLQGKQTHLITLSDKVSAYTKKLDLWKTIVFQGDLDIFYQLYELTDKPENAVKKATTVDKFDF